MSFGGKRMTGLKLNVLLSGRIRSTLVAWIGVLLLAACGGGGGSSGSPVLGGGSGSPPPIADLSISLDKTTVANNGEGLVNITVTSVDANRVAVPGVPVAFAIDNGGVITPSGSKTGTTGTLSAVATIGGDRTNRTIKVTVTAGTVSRQASFEVVDSVTGGKVASLAMVLDKGSVPNDGTQSIKVTVTALDANRSALGGSPISFKVQDSGDAFVSPAGTMTEGSSGQLSAVVRLGVNRINRTVTVVAISGTVQQAVTFNVVDPLVTSTKQATEISMLLDRTSVNNSGSEFVTATVTAVDNLRNIMPNIPVTYSVDANGIVTVVNSITDAKGQSKAEVRIGSDKTNRMITLTAKNEQLSANASFMVTGARIQATLLPAMPSAGSTKNRIEYRVSDVNQVAMANIPVQISGSGMPASSGKTDAQGGFVYEYTAPLAANVYNIRATAAGVFNDQSIVVTSAQTAVPDAIGSPSAPALTASPSVLKVNTAIDKSNTSDLRVVFVDRVTNKAIQNMRVLFTLPDPSSVGGKISPDNQVLYTDAEGVAVAKYVAGERASPTEGVVVRACYALTGQRPDCSTYSDVRLTVVSDPLSISVGTNNLVQIGANGLTYVKRYVVLVVDSAGNPRSDVQVNPVVDLEAFGKGVWVLHVGRKQWTYDENRDGTIRQFNDPNVEHVEPNIGCIAEDRNRNGIVDPTEDVNGNQQLDPRKSDVAVSVEGGTKTDANGQAVVRLEYPQSFGSWVRFSLKVTAAGVVSPPGWLADWLPVLGAHVSDDKTPPPFVVSPFGYVRSCSNPN